ncbi:hypothetical protein [Paenibacillus sp. Leaf72]|uniref:hypothetical protein n=1 Tax=Paenibacillus sp. Leaf72 TaxID=1736234 RepID=UPI0007002E21|nr:hypothetical protein [Paenibacillus sp. Leaf72]KQN96938.1 hypothetical protein ASF12_22985 [Paenibacillus sp. Leaf72]
MAKYPVTYTCGHPGVLDLWGKEKEREQKVNYAERSQCPECSTNNEKVKTLNFQKEKGLPALTGSEKQITWALSIRFSLFEHLEKLERHFRDGKPKSGVETEFAKMQDIALTWIKAKQFESNASRWIDIRDYHYSTFFDKLNDHLRIEMKEELSKLKKDKLEK